MRLVLGNPNIPSLPDRDPFWVISGNEGSNLLLRVALGLLVAMLNAGVIAAPVMLVEDGVARMPIVSGSVAEPVAELRDYLERMTGARFEVMPAGGATRGLHIGLVSDFPGLEVERPGELGAEGFLVWSNERGLFLVANSERGVSHAVSTFLHALGCRWFFPGKTWEIVPPRKTVSGEWNLRQMPSFPTQRRIWYGFGAYPSGKLGLADWERHNRMGGPIAISIGHTWHGLNPEKDFTVHPEWFALVGGKRQPTKPCYSHPAVLERAIASALKQAARGQEMISMTPPDFLGYCECERCLATCGGAKPFEDHRSLFANRPDGTLINVTSETLFTFVNGVAAAVAAEHPQVMIGCYAYSAYSHPPSFALHPKVYLQTTTAFRRTSMTLEQQIAAFGEKTEQVGIREYYSVYQWDWDSPSPGKMAPATLAKDLRFFHRNGVTAINAEASNNWAVRGVGYYLAAQLMWDVDVDVEEMLRDFYQKSFGAAAIVMQRYYARWGGAEFAVLEDPRGVPAKSVFAEKGGFDVLALRAAFCDLDEAVRLVPATSAYRERIDQIRMYAHYLALRYRLHLAEVANDPRAIVEAIEAETRFGGRLTDTHMIHTRPLLGKAFLRRFKKHESLLTGVAEAQHSGKGWRQIGKPPSLEELDHLWDADRQVLGIAE
ncbi:MAG: hypothetical protein ACI9UA_003649 [Pseudoalteromonas tetraodonis]